MCVSVEHEVPVIRMNSEEGVPNFFFQELWDNLVGEGWKRNSFGVQRDFRTNTSAVCNCLQNAQVISTDTGPTLEFATCPALTIKEIESQLSELRLMVGVKLRQMKLEMVGSGVHPFIGDSEEEYYHFRTPRPPYDYAIKERGWSHRSILHIAAFQEVVDVPFEKAITLLSVMHRLAGLILFLCRNDPDYRGTYGGSLSIRPGAWKRHIPKIGRFSSDRHKVWLPEEEIASWEQYLALLWQKNPMFILGTKNSGLVFVPSHPTFWDFLSSPPSNGWNALSLESEQRLTLQPELNHLVQTDWTYMGLARLRWKWREDTDIQELVAARREGRTERFLAEHLEKVLLENRSTACPPPGEEMASLALIVGIRENLKEAKRFIDRHSYSFWLRVAEVAEREALQGAKVEKMSVLVLLQDLLEIAREGLARRGSGEEKYLAPLVERLRLETSSSEITFDLYKKEGMEGVLRKLLYRF